MSYCEDFDKAQKIYNTGDYQGALELFKECLEKYNKHTNSTLLYNIGTCHLKGKEYEEAIPYFRKVLEVNQRHPACHFNLAYCLSFVGNRKESLQHFNTAWALDPSDKDSELAIKVILKNIREEKNNV